MVKKRKKRKSEIKALRDRVYALELAVVGLIKQVNVQDLSVPMHRVDEDDDTGYKKIGFKYDGM